MNLHDEFEALIQATIDDLGTQLDETKEKLAEYGTQQAVALALIIQRSEPGFDQALIAARNNLAMRAGIAAGNMTRNSGIWTGVFSGALRMAAVNLAGPIGGVAAAVIAGIISSGGAVAGSVVSTDPVTGGIINPETGVITDPKTGDVLGQRPGYTGGPPTTT